MSFRPQLDGTGVCNTFSPAASADNGRPDLIVHSTDAVLLYCHQALLAVKSSNHFNHLLGYSSCSLCTVARQRIQSSQSRGSSYSPEPRLSCVPTVSQLPTVFVSEESQTFSVVLHMVYNIPLKPHSADLDTIRAALGCLEKYGCSVPENDSDIWTVLLEQAPANALSVYGIGATYSSDDSLCTLASQYTLSSSLTTLTEADSLLMGPLYMRRLFVLHIERLEELKNILRVLPDQHPPTADCPPISQSALRSQWEASIANILMQDCPQNTQTSDLVENFGPIFDATACHICKESINSHISWMVQDWARVKRTI